MRIHLGLRTDRGDREDIPGHLAVEGTPWAATSPRAELAKVGRAAQGALVWEEEIGTHGLQLVSDVLHRHPLGDIRDGTELVPGFGKPANIGQEGFSCGVVGGSWDAHEA